MFSPEKLPYRAEIDGLRAFAVTAIILYHAGFRLFSGGFVGVDIFFVISGYLITSIIRPELTSGQFRLARFYVRRARRILPALFSMVLFIIPFAWMWMKPRDMLGFSASVLAVLSFFSNFLFWQQSGYFDIEGELKPLLHTWSLAVEEQFYLLFPITLMVLWRFGQKVTIAGIAAIGLASFALCEYASRTHPSLNFYWPLTRIWELAIGSLCSFVALKPNLIRDEALSFAGLAAAVLAVLTFDATTRYPSIYALAPVIGTALILTSARGGTIVQRILSIKPAVAIGLISYSAYLWHNPILSFLRIRSIFPPSVEMLSLACVVSLIAAYVSWRFVETPFRNASNDNVNRHEALLLIGFIGSLLLAFGVAGYVTNGFPERFDNRVGTLEARVDINYGLDAACNRFAVPQEKCKYGIKPNVLLWGDSFAMHLADAMKFNNIQFLQMTMTSCAPIKGIALTRYMNSSDYKPQACINFNNKVIDFLRSNYDFSTVVMASPFDYLIDRRAMIEDQDRAEFKGSAQRVMEDLEATIGILKKMNKDVIVVSPPPRADFDIGQCLVKATMYGLNVHACDFYRKNWSEYTNIVYNIIRHISRTTRVVWLDKLICDNEVCHASEDGIFIYRDSGHLSREGSIFLGRRMRLLD